MVANYNKNFKMDLDRDMTVQWYFQSTFYYMELTIIYVLKAKSLYILFFSWVLFYNWALKLKKDIF